MFWRSPSAVPGVLWVVSHAAIILATSVCTEVAQMRDFKWPRRKKSNGVRSGDRDGQAVHTLHSAITKCCVPRWFLTAFVKRAEAPSCWNLLFPSRSTGADVRTKETFLTTRSLSQIAPHRPPYNPWKFVKTILLHPVYWRCMKLSAERRTCGRIILPTS
jgi:hypothetical protein